jgi:anti-sigma factor RsiW
VTDACKAIGLLVGAHLDGQLDPVKTLEVEEHLAACESCHERIALDRAIRTSLKKTVKTAAPDDVKARMLAAMAGEAARDEQRKEPSKGRGALRHWRTMLPLASAAALALAWGAASNQPVANVTSDVMRAGFGNDDLLRDFVNAHSRAYPPESTDTKQLSRYVGVPVRAPKIQNAKFVGSRLYTVHGGEAAAMLQYELRDGQRLTFFVYNPHSVRVAAPNLAPRAVGTASVRVGRIDGYSVVLTQHDGIDYAVASDLDPEQSAKIVAVVDRDPPAATATATTATASVSATGTDGN